MSLPIEVTMEYHELGHSIVSLPTEGTMEYDESHKNIKLDNLNIVQVYLLQGKVFNSCLNRDKRKKYSQSKYTEQVQNLQAINNALGYLYVNKYDHNVGSLSINQIYFALGSDRPHTPHSSSKEKDSIFRKWLNRLRKDFPIQIPQIVPSMQIQTKGKKISQQMAFWMTVKYREFNGVPRQHRICNSNCQC